MAWYSPSEPRLCVERYVRGAQLTAACEEPSETPLRVDASWRVLYGETATAVECSGRVGGVSPHVRAGLSARIGRGASTLGGRGAATTERGIRWLRAVGRDTADTDRRHVG